MTFSISLTSEYINYLKLVQEVYVSLPINYSDLLQKGFNSISMMICLVITLVYNKPEKIDQTL